MDNYKYSSQHEDSNSGVLAPQEHRVNRDAAKQEHFANRQRRLINQHREKATVMAHTSEVEASQLVEYLTEIECVAEDILTSRREIIDLDRQRNKTREAIRALQKLKDGEKTWMCAGRMFLKMENKNAIKMLNKDFDELDKEIGLARTSLRPKVNKLRDLEKKDELKGFDLCPLTPEERKSVENLI